MEIPYTRRRFAKLTAAALLVPLAGSSTAVAPLPALLSGTFLQIWPDDLKRSPEAWRELLYLTRLLGCTEITIQWLAYGPDQTAYTLPDTMLGPFLDYAAANAIAVRLGLPYDYRYWDVLAGRLKIDIGEFLDAASRDCAAFIGQLKWSRHPAFAGWYLPYEIEQYSWRYTGDAGRLIAFLHKVADAVAQQTLIPLGVSTFSSKLLGGETLAALWTMILDQVRLRPMVQDGVGSARLDAYRVLKPLCAALAARNAAFDLVIELFTEQTQASHNGSAFEAVAASYDRVHEQIALAAGTGAERLIGFAIEPYMLGNRAGARALLADYRAGISARSRQPPGFAMPPAS